MYAGFTIDEFVAYWLKTYPLTIPISHFLKHDYKDRWFRIHSLPESKRYAENQEKWDILLSRQNEIMSDLLGDNEDIILVSGLYFNYNGGEANDDARHQMLSKYSFRGMFDHVIELSKPNKETDDKGVDYLPCFALNTWAANKFDDILKAIADDEFRVFFMSIKNECIIAPYDGGVDLILKDTETKERYKEKYKEWLSKYIEGL